MTGLQRDRDTIGVAMRSWCVNGTGQGRSALGTLGVTLN